MRARGRGGDPQTLDELRALEGRELGGDDPAAQQLLAVQALADATLRNDGTVAELHAQVQALLERSLFFERPSWDEYFMAIARVVASRSNCVKRKVAAVITRDRRIISTGYNGTPRGTLNCNEGGCPRCNSFAEGGTRLDECLCSHGEENAITQAAYHGVLLKGGTIYTTFSPCLICTKMIINAGLTEVVYNADYPLGETSLNLLREAGVKVRKLSLGAPDSSLDRATASPAIQTSARDISPRRDSFPSAAPPRRGCRRLNRALRRVHRASSAPAQPSSTLCRSWPRKGAAPHYREEIRPFVENAI